MQQTVNKVNESVAAISVPADVVRAARRDILGVATFLVTETVPLGDELLGGIELRGNTRVEPTEAARVLQEGLDKRCAVPSAVV